MYVRIDDNGNVIEFLVRNYDPFSQISSETLSDIDLNDESTFDLIDQYG